MALGETLRQFLKGETSTRRITGQVATTIECISKASSELAQIISSSLPTEKAEVKLTTISGGDTQKPLDILAHNIFEAQLSYSPASMLISEEREDLKDLKGRSSLCVAIDPLDGSSNIETNISIGTIFSIIDVDKNALSDPIDSINNGQHLAAGFFIYGPQTTLALSCGKGVSIFSLNIATGEFILKNDYVCIPRGQKEFAINASNYRYWESNVRHFVDDCLSGREGPLGADYNMRWNASLVAEAYRILIRGGVFLYPCDSRQGYEKGRIRLLCGAKPIAFVIEQAGGRAIDGRDRILDRKVTSLHDRVPLIFGSIDKVDQVEAYFTNNLTSSTRSPLFASHKLLRN